LNYFDEFKNIANTHCIVCYIGINIGVFAAFCKEHSSKEERVFRFYIEFGMHDQDIADVKKIVQEHFEKPVFVFIPNVPTGQISQMIEFVNNKNKEN